MEMCLKVQCFSMSTTLGRSPAAEAAFPVFGATDNDHNGFIKGIIYGISNLEVGRRD